jgi:hypothetical protein
VHLHADLVLGLPGEDLESAARSFDRLIATGVQEIQVGLLKRLRGAPIARHDRQWEMVYNPAPPYEVLQTKTIDFAAMQRLKRFARYFDLVHNSGNFASAAQLIWRDGSPFGRFLAFADWLYARTGATSGIALDRLAVALLDYLADERGIDREAAATAIYVDFFSAGRRHIPAPIREQAAEHPPTAHQPGGGDLPRRQRRHHNRE